MSSNRRIADICYLTKKLPRAEHLRIASALRRRKQGEAWRCDEKVIPHVVADATDDELVEASAGISGGIGLQMRRWRRLIPAQLDKRETSTTVEVRPSVISTVARRRSTPKDRLQCQRSCLLPPTNSMREHATRSYGEEDAPQFRLIAFDDWRKEHPDASEVEVDRAWREIVGAQTLHQEIDAHGNSNAAVDPFDFAAAVSEQDAEEEERRRLVRAAVKQLGVRVEVVRRDSAGKNRGRRSRVLRGQVVRVAQLDMGRLQEALDDEGHSLDELRDRLRMQVEREEPELWNHLLKGLGLDRVA